MGQSMTYPLDTMRRRMQTDSNSNRLYTGIWSTAKYIWKNEGIKAFYKGLSLNWLKGPVASSVSFTVFHNTSKLLDDYGY